MMTTVHHHTSFCITCVIFFFLLDVVHPSHLPVNQASDRKFRHLRVRDVGAGTTERLGDQDTAEHLKARTYMKKIFEKYGSNNGLMTFEGFEHLLENLGFGNVHIPDHDVHDHRDGGGQFKDLHDNHHHHNYHQINESEPLSKKQKSDHTQDKHSSSAENSNMINNNASNINDHSDDGKELHTREIIESTPHKAEESNNNKRNRNQRKQRKHRKSQHQNSHHIQHDQSGRRTFHKSHKGKRYRRVKREVGESSHDHAVGVHSNHTGQEYTSHDHSNYTNPEYTHENMDHSDHEHGNQTKHVHDDHGHTNHDHDDDTNHDDINHDHASHNDSNHNLHSHDDSHDQSGHGHDSHDHADHVNSQNSSDTNSPLKQKKTGADKRCLSPRQILASVDIFNAGRRTVEISETTFMHLCPVLLYQIDSHSCNMVPERCPHIDKSDHCSKFHGFHDVQHAGHDHEHDHDDHEHPVHNATLAGKHSVFNIPLKVWGSACLSVLIISFVGLLGVGIVPVMQKVFYTQLLQFLIALAIGSLTSDALLHLLPHALLPHDRGHDSHEDGQGHTHSKGEGHDMTAVWKGLVGLGGFYLFFQMERLMAIYADWKQKRKTRLHSPVKNRASCTERKGIGARLCNHSVHSSSCEEIGGQVEVILDKKDVCELFNTSTHELQELQPLDVDTNSENPIYTADDSLDVQDHSNGHSHGAHGHGHSHVTADNLQNSVASIAWLVIMGDGLHNFTDGLAIGASFSNSISGGLSTSVAVFCHELPHELGDFAVLLQAGMSIKQAMIYNILSSALCFFGMIIGVCVGNITEATSWIFTFTAGTFIYIALVDMLPELTSVEGKLRKSFMLLILQNIGLLTGMGIMLLIALYEDKIQVTFNIS